MVGNLFYFLLIPKSYTCLFFPWAFPLRRNRGCQTCPTNKKLRDETKENTEKEKLAMIKSILYFVSLASAATYLSFLSLCRKITSQSRNDDYSASVSHASNTKKKKSHTSTEGDRGGSSGYSIAIDRLGWIRNKILLFCCREFHSFWDQTSSRQSEHVLLEYLWPDLNCCSL